MNQSTLDTTSPGPHESRECEWCRATPATHEALWGGVVLRLCFTDFERVENAKATRAAQIKEKARRTRAGR